MKQLVIAKTGCTVDSLREAGEDFEDWFGMGLGLSPREMVTVNSFLGEPLPPLSGIAGIVITGSPLFLTDQAPWNFALADEIRAAIALGTPVLGVCYGHQLLAWAFGGSVATNPNGREIGTRTIELTGEAAEDRLFSGMNGQLEVQVSHLQSVISLPADGVRLGGNDWDANHAFRLGETAWGLQFHPEFDARILRHYIQTRRFEIDNEGQDSDQLLRDLRETRQSAGLLTRFAEIAGMGS